MRKTITNEEIIVALLSSPTIKEASKVLKIRETTLYDRMKDEDFIIQYRKARSELVRVATMELQANLSKAIQTIVGIMNNETLPPQIRLNASEAIIKHSERFTEAYDIIERIETLETRYNEYETL